MSTCRTSSCAGFFFQLLKLVLETQIVGVQAIQGIASRFACDWPIMLSGLTAVRTFFPSPSSARVLCLAIAQSLLAHTHVISFAAPYRMKLSVRLQ